MTAARLNDGTPGRIWRNVQDTADASQILRGGSPNWSNWRRSQDYYTEGLLIWLDADTTIRQLTHNQKSLNDFAALFLGKGGDTTWKVVPYNFDDVVKDLNEVAPYDWKKFLTERLDSHNAHAPLGGIERGGYKLVYTDKPSDMEKLLLHSPYAGGVDVRYSLGLSPGKDGTLSDVVFYSPADKAGFAPGDKIVAVNGHSYSPAVLNAAVKDAKTSTAPIEIITTRKGEYVVRKIDYHDGEKYPHLVRVDGTPDLISDILKPMVAVAVPAAVAK
jgi:predicted metalloprotease with PDZ domain